MELTLFMPPSRDPRPAPMPPPTSGIAALDALLRVHEPLRALPADVVHIVRRFADAPLFVKLFLAMQAQASGATLDRLVQQHSDSMQQEARACAEFERADNHGTLASYMRLARLLKYAAQVGSACVVEWMLMTSPRLNTTKVLFAAAEHGRIAVLELPRVRRGCRHADVNRRMRVVAAKHGQLETYQWLCAHPLDPSNVNIRQDAQDGYDLACAAKHGHLAILQWAYAARRDEWKLHVLENAALFNQQHVMEWIYAEDIETNVPDALQALAYRHSPDNDVDWAQRFEAIVWLHDKYPALTMSSAVLRVLGRNTYHEMPMSLFLKYPERYSGHRIPERRVLDFRPKKSRTTHLWTRAVSTIRPSITSRTERDSAPPSIW